MPLSTAPVTVIVPNYNHSDYLCQRIDSILCQTLKPAQVIVLDDCSTDNSHDLIQRYVDAGDVEFHPNSENTGDPFKQWKKGLALGTQPLVWLAESDDFAEPTFLETLVALAEKYPTTGIVYARSDMVDEKGEFLYDISERHYVGLKDPDRWKEGYFNSGLAECKDYLLYRNTIPNASACLFRKSVFEEIGGPSVGFRLCGDWLTYIKILEVSDIAFCGETLNHYRFHDKTARVKNQKALVETYETYAVIAALFSSLNLSEQEKERVLFQVFQRYAFLVADSGIRNIELWEQVRERALMLDNCFDHRVIAPSCFGLDTAVLYCRSIEEDFGEHCSEKIQFYVGTPLTLKFTELKGICRFDPCCKKGMIEIINLKVIESGSGKSIASGINENSITAAGTCSIISGNAPITLFSFGDDPFVFFPELHNWFLANSETLFDIEITFCVKSTV